MIRSRIYALLHRNTPPTLPYAVCEEVLAAGEQDRAEQTEKRADHEIRDAAPNLEPAARVRNPEEELRQSKGPVSTVSLGVCHSLVMQVRTVMVRISDRKDPIKKSERGGR